MLTGPRIARLVQVAAWVGFLGCGGGGGGPDGGGGAGGHAGGAILTPSGHLSSIDLQGSTWSWDDCYRERADFMGALWASDVSITGQVWPWQFEARMP